MNRAVKFSEIREASPGMKRAALAGIIAEARTPANGSLESLNAEIARYEERFDLRSEDLLKELASGEREETEEVLSWLMLIRLKDRVESNRPG